MGNAGCHRQSHVDRVAIDFLNFLPINPNLREYDRVAIGGQADDMNRLRTVEFTVGRHTVTDGFTVPHNQGAFGPVSPRPLIPRPTNA